MSLTRGQRSLIWVELFECCILCSYCSFWGNEPRTQYHAVVLLSASNVPQGGNIPRLRYDSNPRPLSKERGLAPKRPLGWAEVWWTEDAGWIRVQ